ncbi:MAG: hypothetical protein QOE70_4456 [Chthoniobacter sp.]|jgi:hypothetical protein|nr:hypothetical protein [Chthoniobacter sp.]
MKLILIILLIAAVIALIGFVVPQLQDSRSVGDGSAFTPRKTELVSMARPPARPRLGSSSLSSTQGSIAWAAATPALRLLSLDGAVVKTLPEGLLVRDAVSGETVFLTGHPFHGELADNEAIKCLVVEEGVQRYPGPFWIPRTARSFRYIPPKPKSANWMWERYRNPLEQPVRR